MSIPEHHLDAVYTPGSIDEDAPRTPPARVAAAMMMPLLFVVAFVLCYVSALHNPLPHDLGLTIAGPSSTTQQLASAIDAQASGGFDITQTTDADAAVKAVGDRSAVGAIVIGASGSKPTVTIVTADAGGRIASTAVHSVGTRIATQLGTTATVKDVAPLTSSDPNGVGLFYLIIISSIGGYLTITVLAQAIPRARRRTKLLTAVIAAVLTPIVAMIALSFSVGIFGMDFGQLAAVVGVDAIYVLAVALMALFFNEVLGQAAILGVLVIVLALNFPSTGGSVPESMLPPFWQAIHAVWFGSGALETFRSLIFFGGNGSGWPFARLLIWLAGAGLAWAAAFTVKGRRARTGGAARSSALVPQDSGEAVAAAPAAAF